MAEASTALYAGFCSLIAIVVAAAACAAARWGRVSMTRALGFLAAWMVLTGGLAFTGALERWDLRPPPLMGLVTLALLATVLLSRRAWARSLAAGAPLFVLIGFHSFRLALELLMHRAFRDGIMPIQMSFEGRNLDIATGVLGLALGLAATRVPLPRWLVQTFNLIGLALLANIVAVAVVSTPMFALFGAEQLNVWIAWFPFVWLPTIFVPFALFGHLLLLQRLRMAGSNGREFA